MATITPNTVTNSTLGLEYQLEGNQLTKLLPILKKLINDKVANSLLSIGLLIQKDPVSERCHISQIAMYKTDKRSQINQIVMLFRTHISEKFVNPPTEPDQQVMQFTVDKDSNILVFLKPSENHTLDSIITALRSSTPTKICYKSTPEATTNQDEVAGSLLDACTLS
ncbi:MAG: hypothetical protein KAR79_01955 [Simkaniaceae bacterium]|nr:hypothetical protein [Simkaniaceae bacterium]